MPELSDDTQPAMCYPKRLQYEQWKARADEMGYASVSRFMIDMVEAGYKQLDLSVGYDEETRELREQRNDLKKELDAARKRVAHLEDRLYQGERHSIIEFLAQHTEGASFAEIVQQIIDDTPARVAQHLDEMEGAEIEMVEGHYIVMDPGDDNTEGGINDD